MKLATLSSHGRTFPAIIVKDAFVEIGKHLPEVPDTMIGIIRSWDGIADKLQNLERIAPDGKLSAVTLEAPIPRPGKIFAIGLNYADHCEETKTPLPEKQIWFTKAATAVNPPYAPLELPAASDALDYEAELVAVMGRTCRNVPADRFREVVFGYCVGNDVSVRDWQLATTQWSLGKSFDRSAPIGPWITTADSVDPHKLAIRSFVNGELRQNSNTRHLVFKLGAMIAQLSQAMTLEPGDLIFTGTPGGVGMVWQGKPHYLKPGDRSRIEIEELGAIEGVVERGSAKTVIG